MIVTRYLLNDITIWKWCERCDAWTGSHGTLGIHLNHVFTDFADAYLANRPNNSIELFQRIKPRKSSGWKL